MTDRTAAPRSRSPERPTPGPHDGSAPSADTGRPLGFGGHANQPAQPSSAAVLSLQRTLGNRQVGRLLGPPDRRLSSRTLSLIQAKFWEYIGTNNANDYSAVPETDLRWHEEDVSAAFEQLPGRHSHTDGQLYDIYKRKASPKELFRDDRSRLLEEIRATYFKLRPPHNLLYLGAGADVENPVKSTGATDFVYVDKVLDVAGVRTNIAKVFGSDVTIREASAPDGTTLFVERQPGHVVATFTLKQMGYEQYVKQGVGQSFDVLFDKDSWLMESSADTIKGYTARLNEGGLWITNSLGGEWFSRLFAAVGLANRTAMMQSEIAQVSFGYDTATVYQKTAEYKQQLLAALVDFIFGNKFIFVIDVRDAITMDLEDRREFYEDTILVWVKQAPPAFAKQVESLPGGKQLGQTVVEVCDALRAKWFTALNLDKAPKEEGKKESS